MQALGTGFTAEGHIHSCPRVPLSVPDVGSLMAATAPEASSPGERDGTWCPPCQMVSMILKQTRAKDSGEAGP